MKSKFFMFFAEKVFNMNIRPSAAMNNWFIGDKMIDKIVSGRLGLVNEEKEIWTKYFKDISKSDHNSEAGFYIIFEWPLKAKHTIESILKKANLKVQVEFYFGDVDWMDSKGPRKMASEEGAKYIFKTISHSGHQLIFENPEEVCLNILKFK